MKRNLNFFFKSLTLLTILLVTQNQLLSQDFNETDLIMESFRNKVAQLNDDEKLSLFSEYTKTLVERGNYIQADSLLNLFDKEVLAITDTTALVPLIKTRAFMYKVQRRFSKALEDYIWLKEFYSRLGDKQELIEVNNLLAEYYRAVGNYSLCILHLEYSKALFNEVKPTTENLAYWYSRKAAWSNEKLRNGDSVIFYADFGLTLSKQTDDYYTQALLLNELGYSTIAKNEEIQKGLNYFNDAQQLLYENQRFREYVEVSNNIANFYFSQDRLDTALNILKTIIPISEENKWYGPLQKSLEMTTSIYANKEDIKSWDKDLHKLYEVKLLNQNSLFNILKDELALNYEKEIAEKELEVQAEKTKAAQERANINLNRYLISTAIAFSLLLIATVSFWVNMKFKRKNKLLKEQRLQISKANDELEDSLNQQKTLFKELNHRVKNNLTVLSGLVYLQEVSEVNQESKNSFLTLRNRIQSMALAHQTMYSSEANEKIRFQTYLKDLFLELSNALSKDQNILLNIECENMELDLKEAIPMAMIANELYTNSIKHAFDNIEKPQINILAISSKNGIVFEYTDNGVGIIESQKTEKALGLRLISLLLDQLNATIIDMNPPNGVHFKISIPH